MRQLCFVLVAVALFGTWGCKSHTVDPQPGHDVDSVFSDSQGRYVITQNRICPWSMRGFVVDARTNIPIESALVVFWEDSVTDCGYMLEFTKGGYAGLLRKERTSVDSQTVDHNASLFPLNACLTGVLVEDSATGKRDTITLDFSMLLGEQTGIFPALYQSSVDANGHFRFDSLPATWTVVVRQGAWIWEGSTLFPVDTVISLRYNDCVDLTLCPPTRPSDFPSTVGMWWQYRVSHTLDGAFDDTVTVSIVDTTRMNDGRRAMIWVEQQGASTDTSFVVNDHDTIKVCESREYGYAKAMYPSRFGVGYFRSGLDCGDTTRILDSQLVSVPYSHSVWTYRLNRIWDCIDNAGEVSVWLARGLGVVKSQESRITLIGLSVERRELISFYAPD